MRKLLKAIALIFTSTVTFAQQGNYFLSHFSPSDERIDYLTFGIAQNASGVIYFANKNGVLEFDGRNWGLIEHTLVLSSLLQHLDRTFFLEGSMALVKLL